MSDKRLRGWVQNAALILLTANALFLLTRLPLLQNIRLSAGPLFSVEPAPQEPDVLPAAMLASMNLMVTSDSEHGRCGQLCIAAEDAALQEIVPLFQEALGSATLTGEASDAVLRSSLDHPGLYLELTGGELPLSAAAAWLGEETSLDRQVRAMALTAGGEDTALLFLLDGEGRITRCATALPVSAVHAACEKFSPNGSYFAYEKGHHNLSPYTVLTAEAEAPPDITAERPAGYSAYNLLTVLDFNAHTLSRYTESSGAEVVEESPRTLRIAPDGAVSLVSRGATASNLYRASGQRMQDILSAGWRLASALTEGTGASPLHLRAVEEQDGGYVLRFRCEVNGIPVFFSDGGDALTVTFQGGSVTGLTYRCRSYTPVEEAPAALLPADMAQAIASDYPGAALSVGYEDDGSDRLSAQWYR